MNRKQFALLLFLLIVVGLAGLMMYNRQNDFRNTGNQDLGKKLLGDFPFNDVAHISLKEGTNEVNLVKKDQLWRVRERNDYPANYSEISEFLLKLGDLKVVSSEKVVPSQLPRLALVTGQGTNVALVADFRDPAGKPIRTLLLGKKHLQKSNRPSPFGDMGEGGFPDGRYVKLGAESDTVVLISEPFSNIEPRPDQWLNKDFFKVEKVRSIAVVFPAATNNWKLARETETAEWKLSDAKPGEQLDASKTSALSNPLSSPTFNDVETGSAAGLAVSNNPTLVMLDTFDNFTYDLTIGQKTNDNYALALTVTAQLPKERTPGKDEKPEDKSRLDKEFKDNQKKLEDKLAQEKGHEKWVYLVSSWSLEPVLKERSQLLVEKKEEPKPAATTAEAKAAEPAGQTSTNAPSKPN